MFINFLLNFFQNTKAAGFLRNSLIFENIDNISFALLILTIVSTTFAGSGVIGALAIAFFLSCFFKLIVKKNETVELSLINKIFVLYLLIVVISLFGSSYFALSLKGILKTFTYALFYFSAIYYLSENKKKIIPVIIIVALSMSVEAVIAILQNFSHVEEIATWQDTSNVVDPTKVISRAYGTLKPYNPNLLAGYLIAGISSIVSLCGIFWYKKNKSMMAVSIILFITTFAAIFVTGCRGGYLGIFGLFFTCLIYVIFVLKKHFGSLKNIKAKYKAAILGILAAITGFIVLIPSFSQRILSIFSLRKDSSISFRMNVYEASIQMFSDNKFLGIGVGNKNFREIYGLYMKTGYDALGTYCVPLEIAVESGIFALLFFFAFLILIVVRIIKYISLKHVHLVSKFILFSVLLTIVATMCHGLFDTVFFRPQIQIIFWLNIAIFHAITIKRETLKNIRLNENCSVCALINKFRSNL